jgi:LPXTG-motif cell wall-anchored protein
MKSKFFKIILPVFSAILIATPVFAAAVGQIEGGDIFRVKNVTQGTSFVDPVSATCNDTVQFRARIHNPGPDPLQNVNVKVGLNDLSASISMTADNVQGGMTEAVTDTAGVNLDQGAKLSYVAGSAELLDANKSKIQSLDNSLFTSGVNVGTVGVSTEQKRFVQFDAQVVCEVPPIPPTPTPDCSDPAYAAEHPDECNPKPKDCDDPTYAAEHPDECSTPVPPTPTPVNPDTPVSPVTPDNGSKGSIPTSTPTTLPKTGGEVAGLFGLGGLTTSLGYYISSKRRLSRS